MHKPLVYIASPYSKGSTSLNVRAQMAMFDRLFSLGVHPYAPLLTHYQDILFPRGYEEWMEYCLGMVQRCDALLRMSAACPKLGYLQTESDGADREVAMAESLGIPVFVRVNSLLEWTATWRVRHA